MEYKHSLKSIAQFELKSWFGRIFKNKKCKLKKSHNYLHLGCGSNYIEGYINADFFTFSKIKFWKKRTVKIDWEVDLRYPLNCDDEVFDGVFMEHVLEHLYFDDAKNLLKELYRVLKKGAFIRITVPDLEKYVKFYNKNYDGYDAEAFKSKFKTGCDAISNLTQNYFHLSVWDYEKLQITLEEVGFNNVKKMEYGKSQDQKLLLDLQERAWETLYVEAQK